MKAYIVKVTAVVLIFFGVNYVSAAVTDDDTGLWQLFNALSLEFNENISLDENVTSSGGREDISGKENVFLDDEGSDYFSEEMELTPTKEALEMKNKLVSLNKKYPMGTTIGQIGALEEYKKRKTDSVEPITIGETQEYQYYKNRKTTGQQWFSVKAEMERRKYIAYSNSENENVKGLVLDKKTGKYSKFDTLDVDFSSVGDNLGELDGIFDVWKEKKDNLELDDDLQIEGLSEEEKDIFKDVLDV